MASVDTAGAGELGGLIQALVADSVRRTRRSRPAKNAKVRYFLGVLGRFWLTPSAVSGHRQYATTTLHTITKTRE